MRLSRLIAFSLAPCAAVVLPVGAGATEMPMCGVVTTNCVVSVEQNGAAPTDPFEMFADHGAPGYEEYRVELMDGIEQLQAGSDRHVERPAEYRERRAGAADGARTERRRRA
ncbi:MAG TPA: hypothetical protein VHK22_01455 [Gaiellaceae bacterium]|nr:hypothetical protein [Gaiellaceae bacterium]